MYSQSMRLQPCYGIGARFIFSFPVRDVEHQFIDEPDVILEFQLEQQQREGRQEQKGQEVILP